MCRRTRFCQFEHLRARICRTKSGGGREARICRTGDSRWARRLGFANSNTCALEFAGPRGVVGWAKEGTLGFANSSTCALEFAGPRVVDAQGDSVLPIRALAHSNLQDRGRWLVGQRMGHSVLPIRALARSNLQDRGWWMCRRTRFCQFEHLRARICRTKSGGWTGSSNLQNRG